MGWTFLGIIVLVVVGSYVFIHLLNYLIPYPPSSKVTNWVAPPQSSAQFSYSSFQPTTLYHGTTLQNAFEIYYSGLWMVGGSFPPAVWMGDNIFIAQGYARVNGGIVVIKVDPWVRLTNKGGGVYIYEIPGAVPRSEYYKVQGLTPVGVLNTNGNRLA